jgi:predicted dehydrogenase
MKSLIVGLGSIGRRHGRNLSGLGVEVLGVDPRQDRREAFSTEIKGARTFEKLDEGLAAGCECAVVASPNVFHLEQALTCARAGMHLFIEKPLAVSLDGVEVLTEVVEERQLTVLLGSNWKFHPGPRRMKELIDGGAIGRVLAVHAIGGQYLPDWHPWEDYRAMYSSRTALGGGVLWDSHDMDYLTWLAGPLSAVSCRTARTGTLDIETEDLACMLLAFKSGAQGTLQMDYLQRPYARRVHVTGSQGTVVWEYPEGEVRHYQVNDKMWRTYPVPEGYELNRMYIDEMRHFLERVAARKPTITPLSQAVHVLMALDRARASSEKGGVPMDVA